MSSYIFGPVPSRRLGHSLGVDLVPYKTCSYDCVYCQLKATTHKTTTRKEYVPYNQVVAELKDRIRSHNPIDYITLSGSGEPTLFSRTRELIDEIKRVTEIPVAVLTNGSLLSDPAVRKSLLRADLVVPSLDAGDQPLFQLVNRPCSHIGFDEMIMGLRKFKEEMNGEMWLEVMLLNGIPQRRPQLRILPRTLARLSRIVCSLTR